MNRYSFMGGHEGEWRVIGIQSICGSGLDSVQRLTILNDGVTELPLGASWILQGFSSNVRYAIRDEVNQLRSIQPSLNRPEAVSAVLIPIKNLFTGGRWPKTNAELFLKRNLIIPPQG